jgi:phosphatidate cytidylyltransferase
VNNFTTRTFTALFFAIAMVGSAILGQTVFFVLLLIITLLGLHEFTGMVTKGDTRPALSVVLIAGGLVFGILSAHAAGIMPPAGLAAALPLFFLILLAELWRKSPNPFTNAAYGVLAVGYIALPLGLLMYLFDPSVHSGPAHYGLLLGFLIILWINDSGAYIVGSLIGKHKLFERISPGKTWEGSIGGGLAAMAAAYGLSYLFPQLDSLHWVILSAIIVITGTLGDLVESMLKRSLGLKDSGKILPGHGGILDRFDAVLMSAPFVFVYLALFCR